MSWTAPRTWVTSEVVSAAIMNTHVRDNLLETVPAKAASAGQQIFVTGANAIAMTVRPPYKTADESVNNSTTLQNDDHLAWAVAANEIWAFSAFLYWTIASGDPGVKINFTVPSGSVGWYQMVDTNTNVGTPGAVDGFPLAIASTQSRSLSGVTSHIATLQGFFQNGANAGTVQFQWAQNVAVASNLTLKLGSYIDLKRLA